jgi:hypothetical protein
MDIRRSVNGGSLTYCSAISRRGSALSTQDLTAYVVSTRVESRRDIERQLSLNMLRGALKY